MASPCRAIHAIQLPIASADDVVIARRTGRSLAAAIGFSSPDVVRIATAITELASNVLTFASRGDMRLEEVHGPKGRGIAIVARDFGPGIADVDLVMQDGYSTSGGLGMGLPGVRRLMDEFEIQSAPGKGTTVSVIKWRRS